MNLCFYDKSNLPLLIAQMYVCISYARLTDSCVAQFSLKISKICEFGVIMGIMTGLLEHYLWSKHPWTWDQGEWLLQNFIIRPGHSRVLHKQHRCSSCHYFLNITWTTPSLFNSAFIALFVLFCFLRVVQFWPQDIKCSIRHNFPLVKSTWNT